jgi:hypothetical protein
MQKSGLLKPQGKTNEWVFDYSQTCDTSKFDFDLISNSFISSLNDCFYTHILLKETLIDSTNTPRITKAGRTGAPMDRINASNTEHSMIFLPEFFLITTRRLRLSRSISRTALPIEVHWELLSAFVFGGTSMKIPLYLVYGFILCFQQYIFTYAHTE